MRQNASHLSCTQDFVADQLNHFLCPGSINFVAGMRPLGCNRKEAETSADSLLQLPMSDKTPKEIVSRPLFQITAAVRSFEQLRKEFSRWVTFKPCQAVFVWELWEPTNMQPCSVIAVEFGLQDNVLIHKSKSRGTKWTMSIGDKSFQSAWSICKETGRCQIIRQLQKRFSSVHR